MGEVESEVIKVLKHIGNTMGMEKMQADAQVSLPHPAEARDKAKAQAQAKAQAKLPLSSGK